MAEENPESLGVENLSVHEKSPQPQQKNQEVVKIDILLNATGSAPILKQKKWSVDQEKTINWVAKFVHKYLKLTSEEQLFLYVNQTFAPSPDETLKNLYECYGSNGKLLLNYSRTVAWG